MDDENTANFTEPCAQCSEVNWGISDEGRFYCKSCHNVIERTQEVVDPTFMHGSTRITTIGRGSRTKKSEGSCRTWMVCEGFQFILMNQADALLRLGVAPDFKDQVLCQMWRLFLQKSKQAYTSNPVTGCRFRVRNLDSDSDSAPESCTSASETDAEMNVDDASDRLQQSSGSADAFRYTKSKSKVNQHHLMSMRKTLALIHLALVWSREPLTLSDLLRLVNEGHVPYVSACQELPEEMMLKGRDSLIFRVESVPPHHAVHKEAEALISYLQLRAFPPIGRESLLHPALLSVRYLTDANLPDELHPWVCSVMERAGMADQTQHSYHPLSCRFLPPYELQAAALIIVTMKFIFRLDDHTEWNLSSEANIQDKDGDMFNLRRWYRVTQAALTRAQQRLDVDVSRRQWKAKKVIYRSKKNKAVVMKKKRMAEQVQICFESLSSHQLSVSPAAPSSFRFCWGDEDGADGPSLHHKRLSAVMTADDDRDGLLTPANSSYWHPTLRPCNSQKCTDHYPEVEETLPRSFLWLLQLFCFLLDVKPGALYDEVLKVERRLFTTALPWNRHLAKGGTATPSTKTETRTRTGTGTKTKTRSGTRTKTRTQKQQEGTTK